MRHLLFLLACFFVLPAFALQDDPPPSEPDEAVATEPDSTTVTEGSSEILDFEWLRETGHDTVVCPFRTRIDYEPGEVECGLIQVPENREIAGSRTIELHFVRIAARGEDDEGNEVEIRDDPVIYLTGGPGVTVETYVERLKDHSVINGRDLYILEQRGIGYSGDFCPFFADRNRADFQADNFVDSQRAMFEQARACIEGAKARGVDVTGYHTFENARDIKALRMALGLEDWNVWGISYGSVLGQAYMKVDPEGIRAAVIDAIVPLDLRELMRIPHWHEQNLERLFAACNEQPDCADSYGGLERRYRAAIANMTEDPVRVEVPEGERYPDGETWFFADVIAGLPFSLLYEQSNHPAIPAIIEGLTRVVEEEDETFFRALALSEQTGGPGISMGMSVAVRCLDGYVDRWAESAPDDFRDYPTLARAFGALEVIEDAPGMCRDIGLAPRDPEQFEPVQSDLPVVVANGAWDPITPVPLAEAIMPGFSNGQLVVFPHAGHGPTRSLDCAGDFLNGFYDDPSAGLDMACVEEGEEAAEFIAPHFATRAAVEGMVLHEDHEKRFNAHLAWGGVSALLSLFGLLVILVAWLARRVNGQRLEAAGSARLVVFLATVSAVVYAGGLGAAVKASVDVTEAMMLFGLVSWASWMAWFGPLALLLGLAGLVQIWRYRGNIAPASRAGLLLVAFATVSLAVFGLAWDLWPL
ncbi:alpha/beta hydrolase [Wenzhouxiangella sp. EGI_FJ10305]|uniref:alpha/beta hydrolase n=1 Tax=Wenzhouxiangella sp. EGI_FJ10305 TaxID=3243768 RepID=UPI0035DDB1ED